MNKYWIAVASHEHVTMGQEGGFACVTHGKKKPLEKISPHDGIIYYSPTELFGVKKPLQQFTAVCLVKDSNPYQKENLFDDFSPWAREVVYKAAKPVGIKDLLDDLSFIKNKRYWGTYFRRGVFAISEEDFRYIAKHMGVSL